MSADKKISILLLTGYAVLLGCLLANGYLQTDATFWISLGLAPLVIWSTPAGKKSLWLMPVVLILLLICFFRKELTFRYLLLISAILFVIQSLYGKLSLLLGIVLMIMSPLFRYLTEVFTFPIRLKLSEWSVFILQAARLPASASGNIIQISGSDYSVDPACMGLQMTGFSLLAGIFLIIHEQRKTYKELHAILKILVLTAAFGLNIFSNLMRIITLVMFNITPENPLHDWIGIICLAGYVWMPLSFLVKYLNVHFSIAVSQSQEIDWRPGQLMMAMHLIILCSCGYFIFQKKTFIKSPTKVTSTGISGDYKRSVLESGVTQFRNKDALVYLKPIREFYATEHNPTICWTGSGYELTTIREKIFSGKKIYVGTLKKGNDELQTAWWFSNSKHTTISQLDWRWRAMTGEGDFQLINVTASNQEDLNSAVYQWLPRI